MAKLIRPTETKIFGSTALAAELTPFGSSVPSTDINLILNSTEAQRGWGTIGANGFPPMEWFNALGYGLSYYNAYLMQQGIPQWTALQNYYINSYTIGSDGKLYRSKTGIDGTPNAGNTPVGDTVNWSAPISDTATSIHDAIAENPGDTDEFGYWDSLTLSLRKVTLANFKATLKTYFDTVYAVLNSPAFTGTPTAPNFSYKPTPVTITSWGYVTTTITLNVASHTFVAGDYIEVSGLTATTNIPNGVHLVTSVTATTIVFTYALTPTGTAGVSSATVKGYMTTNGRVESIGVGRTRQNVQGSRVAGTTYTNSTGKPIMLELTSSSGGATSSITVTVNGVTAYSEAWGGANTSIHPIHIIIPIGGTYSVTITGSMSIAAWLELR